MVRAHAAQPGIVHRLAKILRRAVVVARRLNHRVAIRMHLGQRPFKIGGQLVAHRIELQPQRLLHRFGRQPCGAGHCHGRSCARGLQECSARSITHLLHLPF